MTRTPSRLTHTRLTQITLSLAALISLLPQAAQADTKVRSSSFDYNPQGLLTKEVIEPASPNDCLQTSYSYDSYGHKTAASSSACAGATGYAIASASVARTSSTSYGTDARFPVSSSNALSQSETKAYDPRFGSVTSLTGPNGLTTTWTYDSFGRKTRETRSDATYTTWAYKLCSEPGAACPGPIGTIGAGAASISVVISQSFAVNAAANSPEQRSYYDALGRVLRSQSQGFDVTTSGAPMAAPVLVADTEYNTLGQVARQSNQYALAGGTPVWSSYTYDALGRVIQESHPDPAASGGVATTSFANNGLSSTITNPKGQTKTTTKNAQGQVALVTDAQGNTISYSFDALGHLLATNAAGSITTMVYNQRGQKASMLDPAMGAWTYSYNVYGELVAQRDSLNQTVTMAYDVLGRMVNRTEPDLISDWSYDKKFDASACGKGIGKLCEAKANNGYNRKHTYDTLGRPSSTATLLNNPLVPAVVTESYDPNTGRVATKTWPTQYQASYSYSALGYLKGVTGGGTNGFAQTVSYAVQAINAQGQITQYRTGNQVTTVKTIDPISQRLSSQSATKDGQATGNVLNQSYTYDALDNLMSRVDSAPGVGTQESFSYDSLNRLTTATMLGGAVSPPTTTEVKYDARGNITYKSDVGRYWYDAARPNRMTNVTLETAPGAIQPVTGTRALSYAFDDLKTGAQIVNGLSTGNGNLEYTVTHDTANARHTVRGESYTSFNMPNVITYGNFITNTSSSQDRTLSFVYGPEHQRIKENVALTGNGTSSYFAGNTWYLNGEDSLGLSFEREIRDNGTIEKRHYVSAGGMVFAQFTHRAGTLNGLPEFTTSYFHKDQLGSIAVITDETGAVTERLAYDPWGKRRKINTSPGNPDTLDALVGQKTDRGYTEHEHLDEIGVIHMNGRIYDPLIGRFMSADPYVQAPTNLKTFNRYSYVWNNPLKGYDPSGFLSVVGPSEDGYGGRRPRSIPSSGSSSWFTGGFLFTGNSISVERPGSDDAEDRAAAAAEAQTNARDARASEAEGAVDPTTPTTSQSESAVAADLFKFDSSTDSIQVAGLGRVAKGLDTAIRLALAAGLITQDDVLRGGQALIGLLSKFPDYLFGSPEPSNSALSVDVKPTSGADNPVPSNVGPGPNAGESVPAGPSDRPTKEQQDKINEIGYRDGCHTCGSKDPGSKTGNFTGDHQDPNKLNPHEKPQVYYPQCRSCSNQQGGRIRWIPKFLQDD
jgi:RHS repeat-associated protein